MIHELASLYPHTSSQPRLEHNNGMAVVRCGEHTVQFDRDADAHFFVVAHREVPALLTRVRELEAQVEALGQGELEAVRRELARVTGERDAAYERLDETHEQLEAEVKARTAAEARARQHLTFKGLAQELARRALAAEDALAKERKSPADSIPARGPASDPGGDVK